MRSDRSGKSIRKDRQSIDSDLRYYDNCTVDFAQFFELMNSKIRNHGGIDFERAEKNVSCFFTLPSIATFN